MATDDGSNPQTAATGDVNPTDGSHTQRSQDDIKSHPEYQDLEKKYAAARQKMDESNIEAKELRSRLDKIEKKFAPEDPEEDPDDEPEVFTKAEADDFKKEIMEADKIKLAADEYQQYRSKGYSIEDSIRLAHLDKGINESNMEEHIRQAASGNTEAAVDRTTEEEVPPNIQEAIEKGYFTEETYLANKDMVASMLSRR